MSGRQLKVSTRNLVWMVIVIVVGLAAFLSAGWKIGLAAAGAALVISEIVERSARAKRNNSV